jgi:hypothetical protein
MNNVIPWPVRNLPSRHGGDGEEVLAVGVEHEAVFEETAADVDES